MNGLIRFAGWMLLVGGPGCAPPTPSDDGLAIRNHVYTQADAKSQSSTVCPDGQTLSGIDVSHWQGLVDWNAVASDGIDFAFIRVSDGVGTYDSQFPANWANALSAGVVRGVYQYFRPSQDPVAQAELLISEVGELLPGDLPPVIDVETSSGQSASVVNQAIAQWLETVEDGLGVTPMIYTSSYLWGSITSDTHQFSDYPLWAAHWEADCPYIPDAWSRWEVWQFSDSGRVDGISGDVDLNHFNGDESDLLAFGLEQGGAECAAECGDGECSGSETIQNCPEDCGACEAIGWEGSTVEESEDCFEAGGSPDYWYQESEGHGGSLLWTHTTDSERVDNYGRWNLEFEEAGRYLLEAHTPAPWGQSAQALYRVRHGGITHSVSVDQSVSDGWTELGEFEFDAGADQWVRLDDNTGEPYNNGETSLVYDALRLTRGEAFEDSGEFGGGSGEGKEEVGGCGCGSAPGRTAAPLWVLLLALSRRRIAGFGDC